MRWLTGRRREEDPAPRGGLPTIAVITMARDEGLLLSVWVEHYARHVGMNGLVVLDDNSSDGSTENLPCTVHHVPGLPGGAGFELSRMRLVSGIAQGLLAVYDYVAFVDVDEFLIPDPARFSTLPELVAAHPEPVLGVVGLNVVHLPAVEAPLDLRRPLLEQRSFAKFTPLMCKPSVKRVPAPWVASSHGIRRPYQVDPSLFMIHLKYADRDRLASVATVRKAANASDGRAGKSSWSRPVAQQLATFDRVVAGVDPASIPEFDPGAEALDGLVEEHEDGIFRTPQQGQLQALQHQPFVRLPSRLLGAL